MVKVLVLPGVLYGCQTWVLRKEGKDRLEALEIWLWRSLEKIKWQDGRSNDEVLTIVDETRCLIRTIGERKNNWIGHVLRGDGLLRDVLEGRMLGRRPQGRLRMGMIEGLREVLMKGYRRKGNHLEVWRERLRTERSGEFYVADLPEGRKLMTMNASLSNTLHLIVQ
jgi:hypothetical protein